MRYLKKKGALSSSRSPCCNLFVTTFAINEQFTLTRFTHDFVISYHTRWQLRRWEFFLAFRTFQTVPMIEKIANFDTIICYNFLHTTNANGTTELIVFCFVTKERKKEIDMTKFYLSFSFYLFLSLSFRWCLLRYWMGNSQGTMAFVLIVAKLLQQRKPCRTVQ
jgi:hypothetical protein